jgi:hypothetical protein
MCLVAHSALASPTADDEFTRGRQLLAAGKYAEACAAFESSLRLDFQFGTLFNVADCDAKIGKLATSLAAWQRIAKEDRNTGRAQKAADIAKQLEPRVPRLRIAIAPIVTGTVVTLDGAAIADLANPALVDLGSHEVVVTSPERTEVRRKVETTREGEIVAVDIELPAPAARHDIAPPPPPPPAPAVDHPHTRGGKIVTALGGVTLVAGLVIGGLAYRAWHDAQTTAQTDVDAANADLSHVRLLGNVSTALIAAGAVTVGIGVYLWRSGSRSASVTVASRPGHSAVVLAVTF